MNKTIKLINCVDGIDLLPKIGEQLKEIKTQYKLIKLIDLLENEKKNYRTMLEAIYKECLEVDSTGAFVEVEGAPDTYKIKEDKQQEINEKMNELANLTLDIDSSLLLSLEELQEQKIELDFHELQRLSCLIN